MLIYRFIVLLSVCFLPVFGASLAYAAKTSAQEVAMLRQDVARLQRRVIWVKKELKFNQEKLGDLTLAPTLIMSIGLPVGIISGLTGLIGVLSTISYSRGNIPMSVIGGLGGAVTATSLTLGVILSNKQKKRKSYLEMNYRLAKAELRSLKTKLVLAKEALRQQERSSEPLSHYRIDLRQLPSGDLLGPGLMLGLGCGFGALATLVGAVVIAGNRYSYFGAEHILVINGVAALVGFGIGGLTWLIGRSGHQRARFKHYGGYYTRADFKPSKNQLRPPPNISAGAQAALPHRTGATRFSVTFDSP